ncbi:MerR family transcriptional regulator [Nonomuraea sp. NPDC050394]|uniref:MerR family transcriptional regulator n=1 Tax=Nonomuraea sp. NPDC050394 TaxID=3364363 RepID=UPI0037B3A963
MITTGQLAAYAGVTVKAVRHYHQRGLLTEPERDASGYRRYTAQHAIDLVKIKTLAQAGVPLARIKELLAAGTDQALTERVSQLLCARERLAQLGAGGDRPFVSAQVAGYLQRLRELGISERARQMERDGWISLETAAPKAAAAWIAAKRGITAGYACLKARPHGAGVQSLAYVPVPAQLACDHGFGDGSADG